MFSDTDLARRIEGGEALNAAGCGESIGVAGGYATFAGSGSPLTHAIGLGMHGPVSAAEFDRLEDFYRIRDVPVNLDFCPHADPSLLELLTARGYRIVECNNVLAGPVVGGPDARVRIAQPHEEPIWTRTMLEGFFARTDSPAVEVEVGRTLFHLESTSAWLGFINGQGFICDQPVAAGAMSVRAKLALLFADSTIAGFRGRGLHLALIRSRLQHAAQLGCDLATASTAPGSVSQRNYERAGLGVVYTKLNMQRDWL